MPYASAPKAPWVEVWRVAANERRAGQREALLRADDVADALTAVVLVEVFDAEIARVRRHGLDLGRRLRVGDALRAVGGLDVVIDHGERLLRRAHFAAGQAQALEGLRARHLVHEVTVDVEEAGAVRLRVDEMVVPDLVVEGARRHAKRYSVLVSAALVFAVLAFAVSAAAAGAAAVSAPS